MIEISKAVIEKDGRYLLLKRAPHSKSYPNLWDFPGGKHEGGELPEECVVREVKEETSLDIDPGHELFSRAYQDEKHDLIFHFFIPQKMTDKIKLSDDHSSFIWANRQEIKKLDLHPSVKIYFKI